jgi:hypothetical protein
MPGKTGPAGVLSSAAAGRETKIRLIQSGHIGSAEKLLAEIKSAVAGNSGSEN